MKANMLALQWNGYDKEYINIEAIVSCILHMFASEHNNSVLIISQRLDI